MIHKPSYGAFYDTRLKPILKNVGGVTVIICGTLTTDDPDMQEPELKVLRKGFAQVLTSDEIVEAL